MKSNVRVSFIAPYRSELYRSEATRSGCVWLVDLIPSLRWPGREPPSPRLVRFVKLCRTSGKAFDRVARWLGDGWDPTAWRPHASVPTHVLTEVEARLRGEKADG